MPFSSALIADLRGAKDALAQRDRQKKGIERINGQIDTEMAKGPNPPSFKMPIPRQQARIQLNNHRLAAMQYYGSGIPKTDGDSVALSPTWVFAQQMKLWEVTCRWFRFIDEYSQTPSTTAAASMGFYWATSPLSAMAFGNS
jgi:hypothetical protein